MNTRLQVERPITEAVTGWISCDGKCRLRAAIGSTSILNGCST
jgi:acetyl/propionyl-CoA carboxylase alpha subunit